MSALEFFKKNYKGTDTSYNLPGDRQREAGCDCDCHGCDSCDCQGGCVSDQLQKEVVK